MFDYLKYFLFHFIGLMAFALVVMGGQYIVIGLALTLGIYIIGDFFFGDDTKIPEYKYPQILTWQLWLALPILSLILFASVWQVAPTDVLGFGAAMESLTGYDALTAKAHTNGFEIFVCAILAGFTIGMIGTITGHELTHRTWDPVSMLIGRWLLAYSFDSNFAIEHVYGHHRYVSTKDDPATAPRGRNVYAHIVISTIRGNISAWKIEKERLRKKRLGLFSHHNFAIRGYLMSAVLLVIATLMAGIPGLIFFIGTALWGKALLEIVNYMEHYGIVRNPDTPVQPRHSWNTNKRVSSWAMFNLTRHSHHHAQGEVPYHELKPFQDAPMMISGYLTTILVALVPPVWHKLMTPKVLEWDQKYATEEELALAHEANQKSGIKAFMEQDYAAANKDIFNKEDAPLGATA